MRLTEELSPASSPRSPSSPASSSISAAEADARAAEASGLEAAEKLLDPGRLAELLGREVSITHVRSKPGHSLVVAHTDRDGEAGWTMLSVDSAKYHKAAQRAADFGAGLQVHREHGHYLYSGSVWADPALAKELAEARSALHGNTSGETWRVLRYNPRRRVVAALGTGDSQKVVRVVGAGTDRLRKTARYWRKQGLPVTKVSVLGHRRSATIAPLWGVSDLSRDPHPAAAHTAGSAIATLHTLEARASSAHCSPADPRSAAAGLVDVAPWAAQRALKLAEVLDSRLAPLRSGQTSEIHGDLSPDQVVLGAAASHKVRLIDMDRAGRGHPLRDLGSWVAACRRDQQPQMIEAFLAGYTAHARVDTEGLSAWEAYAHLAGAADFFRHRESDWPARTMRALDLTEEALGR